MRKSKLSRKLSLGFMLMAAPIFILSLGMLFVQSRYLIHEEVTESANSMLNTTLHRVSYCMNAIETAVNSNTWMLEENFRPESLRSVSNRIVRLNPNVISSSVFAVPDMSKESGHGFSIYSVDQGDTVATSYESEYDYFDKLCYTQPLTSGDACWVDPLIDNAEGKTDHHEAIATYCRPIKMKDGRIMGVVTADLSFSRMAEIINEANNPYPHAYYMLLDGDGRYLIYPDSTRLFRKTIFTDADPSKDKDMITLGHEMTAGNEGTVHVLINGDLYHVCYRPVPDTDWSLAMVCPDGDAMKDYYHLGNIIIVLLVVGLLLILLLCHHMVKITMSPVCRLIDNTRKMANGQYDETIPTTSDKGVIGQLQNSFAKMQQSLNERMGNLRRKAEETRQHNEALDQAKQQAEDVVSRKNQFIHHMTQQMRMPLNVVMGFADVLGSNTDKEMANEEELSSITGMMKSNVINMNRIVQLLFDASNTDATEKLTCNRFDEVLCNKLSRECIDYTLSHFPQASIQFKTEMVDGNCILTNRGYLMRILRELLLNAVKFSDGKHILLHITQTETSVRFTVQDVGPGLPADLPDYMYKPFTMKDELPEGVGLGLPLAKRHAISLGGNLIIDKDYHEGCRIALELPK